MFKLVIADDDGKQTVVPIVRDEITIGRQEGNTIRLTERNVSRRHGRLVKQNGELYFEEVSARYGTLRNGDRVQGRVEFRSGDVFTIGDYKLFLQNPDGSIPLAAQQMLQGGGAAAPAPGAAPAAQPPQRDATEVLEIPQQPQPAPTEPGKLVIMNTDMAGNEFSLVKDSTIIGRTDDNDICIDHKSISRHHARLERLDPKTYRVVDMGSANGIRVNGERYQTVDLRRGDIIELGSLKLRFVAPGEAFTFSASAATAEYGEAAAKGGSGKFIGLIAVVLILVVGGIIFAVTSGGGGAGGSDSPGESADEQTGGDQSATQTATSYADTLAEGQSLMAGGNWDEAIEVLQQIPAGAPEYQAADQARIMAQSERRNMETFQRALQAEQAGDYEGAVAILAEIPEGSYYFTQALDQGVPARLRNAWVNEAIAESQQAVASGNYDTARQVLQAPMSTYPNESRLTQQLAAVEDAYQQAQAQAAAEREREREERERQRQEEAVSRREETPREETPREETPREETPREERESSGSSEMSREERRERAGELLRQARREGIGGNHEHAIELLNEAKDLDPSEDRIYLMLYTNYSRIGDNRRAARALREYVRRRPNDPNTPEYQEIINDLEGGG